MHKIYTVSHKKGATFIFTIAFEIWIQISYLEQESKWLKLVRIYRQASTILTDLLKNVDLQT